MSLLSSVTHLYIPLYPFLLHIFWSCHIVCTAVFRVIIIICHTFVYTSVPIPVTNILELSYSLYAIFRVIIIICHTFVYTSVPILVTHILELSYSLYGCISCHYYQLSYICIYLCTHSCYTYSGVVILFVRLYFVSLLSSVIHLYIPLHPFLLHIFWSCHIVCTAVFRVIIIICHTFVYTSLPILVTHILELSYSLYGCISCHYYHVTHLYIPLYPFLLHIFWSCDIVCTAVFRVFIIICHTFVYTSVPILVTHILELSYSLYGCISCHYYQLSYICIYLCTHSCYTYSGVVILFVRCISCNYYHLTYICIYLCTHSCYTYSGVVI